jgi:PRC-barrel domain
MRNDVQFPVGSELSYLDASKVSSPAGVLSEVDVLSAEGQRLGSIDGVVIDAIGRHVRYLSVRASGWFGRRRYLVPTDHPGQVEGERKALRLSGDLKNEAVHGVDAAALPKVSEDDLLAMFPPCPA